MERVKSGDVKISAGRVEVRCSGELAAWEVCIIPSDSLGMRVSLNLAEMAELLQLCIRTGRVLPPISRTNLLGRVCTALPELHGGFQFDLNRKREE